MDGSSATPTATPQPTDTPTPAPSPTDTPTAVPTSTPVAPPTVTPTPLPLPTNTPTPVSSTPTPTPSVGVDLAVRKTAQCNQSTGACTFSITVVNNGPGPYTGGVSTQDVISPTVPFTVTNYGGGGGTVCYTGGSAVNCGPHYPVTLPPGGTYNLTLMVQVGATGTFQNCVRLLDSDLNPANNQACVNFSVTSTGSAGTPDLAVQKSGQCNWPYTCVFNITVTNVGSAVYSGSLTVADQPNPPWSTLLAGGGSINAGPPCSFQGPSVLCQVPGLTLAPGQSQTFTFSVYFGPTGYKQPFQNCASVPPSTDGNQANNQSCVTLQPPTPTPTPGP